MRLAQIRVLLAAAVCLAANQALVCAETVDVTFRVSVTRGDTAKDKQPDASGAVVWLTPADQVSGYAPAKPGHYRLVQKDKHFTPHLLVIPTGSTVDFPNQDPFFHNVFSLFDGKRFDLGLYESGTSRGVHFNRDGVSYIFCNIHPEMSAIVVTLPTPLYDVSPASGELVLRSVPAGTYELHVWMEGASARDLDALKRRVAIGPGEKDLGTVQLKVAAHPLPHKNKFGEDYQAPDDSIY